MNSDLIQLLVDGKGKMEKVVSNCCFHKSGSASWEEIKLELKTPHRTAIDARSGDFPTTFSIYHFPCAMCHEP